jgi:RNA polymerase sigma factor (sigma-70 family)
MMRLFAKSKTESEPFFKQVYPNQAIIHKVCNLYSHTKADREDLFQEMLIQLWRAFPSYKSEAKFSTWMYRVCLNTAISGLRKEKRKPLFSFLETEKELSIPEDLSFITEDVQVTQLYNAINQLSDIEKAIILLYIEEKSYEEIAQIIGITISNVGVKISRIKMKLESIVKLNQET